MFYITKFDDIARKEIESWDNLNCSDFNKEYQEMVEALDSDSIKEYISSVLETQSKYEPNEVFSYVLKSEKGNILAFVFFYLRIRSDNNYDMFLQSIAVHPKFRNKGCATKLMATIFANPEKYIGERPIDVGGFVFPWNKKSLNLFDRFADFEKHYYRHKFYLIISDYETVENTAKKLIEEELNI